MFDAFQSGPEPSPLATSSTAMSVTFYHWVSNLHIVGDERIISKTRPHVPSKPFANWPDRAPPPGLFYLVMHEDSVLRSWASSQISYHHKAIEVSTSKSLPLYITAFESLASALGTTPGYLTSNGHPGSRSLYRDLALGASTFPFSKDPIILWSGFRVALRHFPQEFLKAGAYTGLDVRHITAGHLHDVGPRQFLSSVSCPNALNDHQNSSMYCAVCYFSSNISAVTHGKERDQIILSWYLIR